MLNCFISLIIWYRAIYSFHCSCPAVKKHNIYARTWCAEKNPAHNTQNKMYRNTHSHRTNIDGNVEYGCKEITVTQWPTIFTNQYIYVFTQTPTFAQNHWVQFEPKHLSPISRLQFLLYSRSSSLRTHSNRMVLLSITFALFVRPMAVFFLPAIFNAYPVKHITKSIVFFIGHQFVLCALQPKSVKVHFDFGSLPTDESKTRREKLQDSTTWRLIDNILTCIFREEERRKKEKKNTLIHHFIAIAIAIAYCA